MNNPSPNLITVYLDTPLVGPTPEPLEHVPSPGRLGKPSGYSPTSTGSYISGFRRRPTPPPPTLPHSPTDASPHRPGATDKGDATGNRPRKTFEIRPQGENPWQNFGHRVQRGLTPPRMSTCTGGGKGSNWGTGGDSTGPRTFFQFGKKGEPQETFWPQGLERPNPSEHAYRHRGGDREAVGGPAGATTVP